MLKKDSKGADEKILLSGETERRKMADAHRGDSNEKKKDKRHRANRQKLTRKRTDGHKRENI